MSLRIKLFVLTTLVVVITFGIVSAVVSYRSIETAQEDAFLLADEMSAKYSYEIKSELQAARATSESLMTVFQTLIERDEADRDTLNEILQNSLKQKRYIISFCVAFEPNALDGKDAEYAGQYPLYNETGRYAPYWSMQNGVIDVEPLSDFDEDDWYAGARDSGGEYITDPFIFEVQGTPVLMTSLVFPIIIDGEFMGIVSSDMALDSLQEMVSQVNTSGLGEYTEIYSNSGLVVAHPDNQYFNKSIYVTSAYNMLSSNPSLAKDALRIAQTYMEGLSAPDPEDSSAVEEYESMLACVENLKAYSENSATATLDITLLTNNLATQILQLDQARLNVADEATQAIANGETYTVTEDGYYKVYTPIEFSEATNPWSVAVSVPLSEVQQKAIDLRNYVLLISVLGVLFIALVVYLVTRNLTKPILDLADSAEKVGEGNFDVRIPQTKNKDEVGTLSRAFSQMVSRINSLIGELTQKSDELEKKNVHLAELNEMLARARDEAEASNRAKTVFLSNMSHEMRTPLNAIVGMTTIGKQSSDEQRKDESFRKIEQASAHLLSLINDVLEMSKMEANTLELSPTVFDFETMLERATSLVQLPLKDKQQALDVQVDERIPSVLIGDDLHLSQVIVNLLSNAIKFTDEQGTLGLKTSVKNVEDAVYTLQFEISDNGIGISEDQQTKLFHLFEQADNSTSRSFGGTGIGLALSKRIVELMDGEIWVESELGKGSTFFFTVKLQYDPEASVEPSNNEVEAKEGLESSEESDALASGTTSDKASLNADEDSLNLSSKSILLAEDIEINREIVIAMLEDTQVKIDCAVNGREAVEKFSANPDAYDLILMDIQMPEMDGVEATRLIREINTEVPIIALTANVFKEDVEMYLKSGINDHIGKPLDYETTLRMLMQYLC